MARRKMNPLDRVTPRWSFDLLKNKVKIPVAADSDLYYKFNYTIRETREDVSEVFRKIIYQRLGIATEEELIAMIKIMLCQRLDIGKHGFSAMLTKGIAEYIIASGKIPDASTSLQKYLLEAKR
jgi:hypothetical protein